MNLDLSRNLYYRGSTTLITLLVSQNLHNSQL